MVVAGALIIAGIGFAGSYAAVRELALKKGFGNFSYVFPIGIDAGIGVLLALDLLLTWIRIPFPMLRQTAWLLTMATIAFNGAAAWPDPLGVGMHAVIPVLFVVAVEAARHAIGRIADITADKHMEGVRLTRWLLSPIPTFLLWRRMKLWELRSYEQVIKLEQDRLVYQARLHSRFGRAWRRKAPVESLMPLRLARYGIPLAETAPAGLAAAGIDTFTNDRFPDAVALPRYVFEGDSTTTEFGEFPTAERVQAAVSAEPDDFGDGEPAAETSADPAHSKDGLDHGRAPVPPTDVRAHSAKETRNRRVNAGVEEQQGPEAGSDRALSVVDRYYLAWRDYQSLHGQQPSGKELSAHLAGKGVTGRGGSPVSPSTLRRYLLHFRIYQIWAEHRHESAVPSPHAVAQTCAQQEITAQYNRAITTDDILNHTHDYERRWQTIRNSERERVRLGLLGVCGEEAVSARPCSGEAVDAGLGQDIERRVTILDDDGLTGEVEHVSVEVVDDVRGEVDVLTDRFVVQDGVSVGDHR
ncbi:DUF2637 domain-containing protein [Streptomyces sp. NPDC026665]|uniref:DUF2637 domain-containing protein n=1 Tax=Streptomyces sp. NPDC026665 TaxID=3154798 RepID=UPI0033E870E8